VLPNNLLWLLAGLLCGIGLDALGDRASGEQPAPDAPGIGWIGRDELTDATAGTATPEGRASATSGPRQQQATSGKEEK
jgi:hypothetical protein